MKIEIEEGVSVERNASDGHCVDATITLSFDGVEIGKASVRHNGLSQCGEAFYSDVSFEGNIPKWLKAAAEESVKDYAHEEITDWWDYDGSNWSEPVDEPDEELADEPDDDHTFAVVKTAFHGGGIKGYAVSEESAEAWVEKLNAGSDCKCGCFGVCAVSDLKDLPSNDGNQHDPYSLMR